MTSRINYKALQESVQSLEASIQELQGVVKNIPNEERFRQIAREESHAVVERDMRVYEQQFESRDAQLIERFEALAKEMQKAIQSTVLKMTEITEDNAEIQRVLREHEISIKKDLREMLEAYTGMQKANTRNVEILGLRLDAQEEETTRKIKEFVDITNQNTYRIASELVPVTGRSILDTNATRVFPNALSRIRGNEEKIGKLTEAQRKEAEHRQLREIDENRRYEGLSNRLAAIDTKLDAILNRESNIKVVSKIVYKVTRKIIAHPMFLKAAAALLGSGGLALLAAVMEALSQ